MQEPRAVGDADMEVQRPTSPLGELFDPMSVLVEDAVSFEPPELVYDFIDRLFTHQLPPPAGAPLQSVAIIWMTMSSNQLYPSDDHPGRLLVLLLACRRPRRVAVQLSLSVRKLF